MSTPMYRIGDNLFLKMELFNPGGSLPEAPHRGKIINH